MSLYNFNRKGAWEQVEQRVGSSIPCSRSLHTGACWRDNLLIFGGFDGHIRLNDLYAYNFTTCKWSILNYPNPPTPRDRHSSIVYDNKFIIFGGFDGSSRVNDLIYFQLDTNVWHRVTVSSGTRPSPRHSHSAVVWRDRLFIFGGYDGTYKNDFHEFNISTSRWTQVTSQGEPPRARYRGTCVVYEDWMILHGGHDGTGHLQDTHVFNFLSRTWSVLETTGQCPSPRDSHTAVIYNTSMFLFGGSTGSASNDFFELNLETKTWSIIESSTSSSAAAAAAASPRILSPTKTSAGASAESPSQADQEWGTSLPPLPPLLQSSAAIGLTSNATTGSLGSTFVSQSISDASESSTQAVFGQSPPPPPPSSLSSSSSLILPETSSSTANSVLSARFCHVAAVHQSSLYVFGGFDGVNRLTDFMKFSFISPEDLLPPSSLINDLKRLVNNELLSDISFIVEEQPVRAHKILCLRCPYFRSMLTGEFMESRANEIAIADVKHNTFLQFMEFIYSDHVEITFENAMELFQVADKFNVDRLKKACELVMLDSLDVDTAGHILYLADEYSAAFLREKCLCFVVNNFDVVSRTTSFEDLVRNNIDIMFEILKRR